MYSLRHVLYDDLMYNLFVNYFDVYKSGRHKLLLTNVSHDSVKEFFYTIF